jgi:chromosomal replication initiator protein
MSEITEIFEGMTKNKGRGITMNKIISTIGKYYGISTSDIKGKSRKAEVMLARHLSIYFIRTMLGSSLMDIGKEFSRDHTTIISSIRKIEKDKETNDNLSHAIYSIRKEITGN